MRVVQFCIALLILHIQPLKSFNKPLTNCMIALFNLKLVLKTKYMLFSRARDIVDSSLHITILNGHSIERALVSGWIKKLYLNFTLTHLSASYNTKLDICVETELIFPCSVGSR